MTITEAIHHTEYKYFGDYEFSDAQREAVDVLVATAKRADRLDALEAENTRLRDGLIDAIGWIAGISISGAVGRLSRLQVIRRELLQRLRRALGGQP